MKVNNKNFPLISIVVPCYNYGAYLMDAIDSALAQTYKNIEIIVVNDGSTDKYTLDLLGKIRKKNIKIINQENKGPSEARNRGIKEAKGKYILPLDADNKIDPDFLTKTHKYLKDNNIGIVYVWMQRFGISNKLMQWPDYNFKKLLLGNYIDTGSLFRKSDWRKVGGFKKMKFYGIEDWDFWISIAELGLRGVCVKEPLFYYRTHKKSLNLKLRNNNIHYALAFKEIYNNHFKTYKKYGEYIFIEYNKINYGLSNRNKKLIEKNNTATEIKNKKINELSNVIINIQKSYSWKLTSPFRKFYWAISNPIKFIAKYKKYVR